MEDTTSTDWPRVDQVIIYSRTMIVTVYTYRVALLRDGRDVVEATAMNQYNDSPFDKKGDKTNLKYVYAVKQSLIRFISSFKCTW